VSKRRRMPGLRPAKRKSAPWPFQCATCQDNVRPHEQYCSQECREKAERESQR
jgi:hypothetical protein